METPRIKARIGHANNMVTFLLSNVVITLVMVRRVVIAALVVSLVQAW